MGNFLQVVIYTIIKNHSTGIFEEARIKDEIFSFQLDLGFRSHKSNGWGGQESPPQICFAAKVAERTTSYNKYNVRNSTVFVKGDYLSK